MKIRKVLLANHFFFTKSGSVHGPANVICEYFRKRKKQYILLNYPLIFGRKPYYEKYDGKSVFYKDFGINIALPLPVKSFLEILNSIIVGIFFRPDIYIGVDPLNAVAGLFLKGLGFVKKTLFYSVDYTPTRFENGLLNSAYQVIDRFSARFSDEVWNVSTRIIELRVKQNIKEEKIKFLPNSPNFGACPRLPISKVDKNKIVMVAGLTHNPVFSLVLESFASVSWKHPKLTMNIIGTGKYEANLRKIVDNMGLSSKIKFLGQLENKEVLREVAKCRLGLALYPYSKRFSWVYYGDSKKTREYLACGVPVVMNDVVATSEDVKKYEAGIVIKPTVKELSRALNLLLTDNDYWLNCRKNAIRLAKDYDLERILDKVFL